MNQVLSTERSPGRAGGVNPAVFHQIAESSPEAVVIIDDSSRVVFWNGAAERLFGFPADFIMGRDIHDHVTPERHRERAKWAFGRYQSEGYANAFGRTVEIEALRADGEEIWIELTLNGIRVRGQRWAFAFIRDVTDRRRRIEELEQLAQTDELTGIANRRAFTLTLERHRSEDVHVLIYDLDRFKQVNDQCGHPAGDGLLRELAERFRLSCPAAACVARLGGDEFGAIWVGVDRSQVVSELFRLRQASNRIPNPATGESLKLSGGVAASRDVGHLPYRLTRAADRALYQSKRAGGNRWTWTRTPEGLSGEWIFP